MAAAPRYARPFVAVFLAMLVVCALAPLNLWPFSNWELFSRLRPPVVNTWEAVAVERRGGVIDRQIAGPTACRALLRNATRVRIYRVEHVLSRRAGTHAVTRRTFVATCGARGTHASS